MIWEPGDLALCTSPMDPGLPTVGSCWHVAAVKAIGLLGEPEPFLQLLGQPTELWFAACLFTKLRPHAPDADDAEVIRAMGRQRAPV